jgi:K+-transporting ATPase ATPase C chain
MRLPTSLARHLAALRALLVLTVLLGLIYPLLMVAIDRLPGLAHRTADSLIGQSFTGHTRYFQSRPSAAGDGYDPTATGASNLGPESVVDTLPDKPSLLTQVCTRSLEIGRREGVDGSRPFCTSDGVGAVLAVWRKDGLTGAVTRVVSVNQTGTPFLAVYDGVPVQPAQPGHDYVAESGIITPIRGGAPAKPVVPPDAVTASGSGLDPDISPAYAALQAPRIARERGLSLDQVHRLIKDDTAGRALGFLGEPAVNVLKLNRALDGTPDGTR